MIHPDDLAIGSKPAPGPLLFVQGFVNTIDIEAGSDALDTVEGLASWLAHHGFLDVAEVVTEEDRERAVVFREAIRELLYANHGEPLDPEAAGVLREALGSALLRFSFDTAGAIGLEPAVGGVPGAIAALGTLIYRAMLDGSWERLKVCRNDGCRWAFYDASRNRSGSWCSMEVCGNRLKVRAHRRRHAGAAGG